MSAVKQAQDLQKLLDEKAPNLQARIIPRGYEDVGLPAFFQNVVQQKEFEAFLENHTEKAKACSTPNCGVDVDLKFFPKWKLDFERRVYQFQGPMFLCPECAQLIELEPFLCHLNPTSPGQTWDAPLKKFLQCNQYNVDGVEGLVIFQECISIAYSLKLLSSSIPSITLVDQSSQPIHSNITPTEMKTLLFPPTGSNKVPTPSRKRKASK